MGNKPSAADRGKKAAQQPQTEGAAQREPERDLLLTYRRAQLLTVTPFSFGNPKVMTAPKRHALGASLREYGQVLPLLVRAMKAESMPAAKERLASKLGLKLESLPDPEWELLDGHQRWPELYAAGITLVELKVIDCPDDLRARQLVLALQNTGQLDAKALDAFVLSILKDGANQLQLTKVTGLTAESCAALARRGTAVVESFLRPGITPSSDVEQIIGQGAPAPTAAAAAPDPRASLPPELGGLQQRAAGPAQAPSSTQPVQLPQAPNRPAEEVRQEYRATFSERERVSFSVELDPDQNIQVRAAIAAAKRLGAETTAEALADISQRFIESQPS